MSNPENSQKAGIMNSVTDFMFRKFSSEKKKNQDMELDFLTMRTRIKGKETLNNLMYYAMMWEHLKIPIAKHIAQYLELCYISQNGDGRKEGIEAYKAGQFPLKETLLQGYERGMKQSTDEGEV